MWSTVVGQGAQKFVDGCKEVLDTINNNRLRASTGSAFVFLGWLELSMLGFKRCLVKPSQSLVVEMVQKHKHLVVENQMIHIATILESCYVDQPLEVAN